jgi:tetratricopeptide (TPR) repeat protein
VSSATALLAGVESSIASGAWDQALEQLESIKQNEPKEPNVYRRLAHVQSVRGKFNSVITTYVELIGVLVESDLLSEAEAVIGTVLSLKPECEAAREKRVEIERKRGNTDRAVYLARELARLCIEQGEGDRSIRLLQEAQSEQPENLDISLELAEMFVSHGQIQDGANQYRKVANAFQEAGNIAKAAEAYRRMKVVQSDDPNVLLTLGRLYTELGKLDEAEQEFRSVLRHDLEHQDALLELGLVCQLKGRFRSGLLAFNKVLQNNPKLPRAMRKLGELNLSMGKQSEAVQHFLEAAQAYLEVEEREQAVDIFQIVLGVEEGNAQAQQGLTNLGAPLEAKEFVPPLPPAPPDDEPPTPEAGLVSASDLGELPPAQHEPEPPSSAVEEKKAESSNAGAGKSSSSTLGGGGKTKTGSKGRRKGLVTSGGLGLRKGLVDPSAGGGKPMLGKPTLGGGGSPRAGLRRPGLGMKIGGGEKPMLGMSKPRLERRPAAEPDAYQESQSVSSAERESPEALESIFDNADQSGAESGAGFEQDFDAAADGLFDNDGDTPFGEGLADSLFDSSESSAPPRSPVIGVFDSHDEAGDDSGSSPEAGFLDLDEPSQGDDDDIFGIGDTDDLFGDHDGDDGDIFGDDSLSTGLFDQEDESGSSGDDPFSGLDEPEVMTTSRSTAEADSSSDLFGGEQFDNLFDDPGPEKSDANSATIGQFGSMGVDDLFAEDSAAVTKQGHESSAFDSLFSEATETDSEPDDLFATQLDVAPSPGVGEGKPGGLFDESPESTDLFGEDMFPVAEESATQASSKPKAESADNLFGGMDLFSEEPAEIEPMESRGAPPAEASLGGLFDEEPSNGLFEESSNDELFSGGGLFEEGSEAPVGQFSDGPTRVATSPGDQGESFDLFSEVDEISRADESPSSTGGLFDGFGSGTEVESPGPSSSGDGGLFDDAPTGESLFGDDSDDGGLFGDGPGVVSEKAAFTETSLDVAGGSTAGLFDEPEASGHEVARESSQGLFDIPNSGGGGLFDETPSDLGAGSLFDEPSEPGVVFSQGGGLFDTSEGGLFDDVPVSEPELVAPLGLELPMPGDPPMEIEVPDEPTFESSESLFDSEPVGFAPEDHDDGALTMDQLRAEEMAKVVDVVNDESAESPEFMKLLEMTLPRAEEDVLAQEESVEDELAAMVPELTAPEVGDLFEQADRAAAGEGEGDLFDSSRESLFDVEQEAADPEPEPDPIDEGPNILGKPKVSLSIEDESPQADVDRANSLDASLTGSDVAAKIAAYRKALEETSDNLVMRTRLADIHLKYGMLEDALLQYRQVIRKNTESISLLHRVIQAEFWTENYPEAGESLLALAKLHLKRGEHHDALDTLQSVLSLDSHHFEARKVLVSVFTTLDESKLAAHHLRQLAETALTKGEVDEAVSAFQQLLDISNDPVFEERLAQIYESQGDMERALTSFQSLVGRYQQEERWEEAARVTERIVELNPELLDDRGSLVELYKKLGMSDKAMEQQHKLARAYQDRGELEAAVRLFEGVLDYNNDDQDARRRLVDAYLDSGHVTSALEQAEALTEHYLTTKDHATAIELYSRLVGADSENVELQERLVKFYGLAGDPESAKARWIELSDLHESRGRFGKAADALNKALELDSGQVDLQHRLALLYAEKLDDKVAALSQLRKLFQLAPERLDAVQMYISILLKEEQVSEAGQVLQQLEQAGGESLSIKNNVITALKTKVESDPADLKARFNYGELCYHLGDLDHAIEQFQQTRRNPDFELLSYNMLGLCFAIKKGFNMLDLAIKQFKRGLETKGHTEQAYLELRYNLAMIQYQNGRITESLNDFKECYRVDITYRDVRSWIEKIESELASSGS